MQVVARPYLSVSNRADPLVSDGVGLGARDGGTRRRHLRGRHDESRALCAEWRAGGADGDVRVRACRLRMLTVEIV